MRYIIMAGGQYDDFTKHKALTEVNGEPLIKRTTRLLQENGVNYTITVNEGNDKFDIYGKTIKRPNSYRIKQGQVQGWWVDAFYNTGTPTCYLFGDVYYTEQGLKQIIEHRPDVNTLYGTINRVMKNWEEPLAYKVVDPKAFFKGIEKVKELHKKGQCNRHPIVWELYRVLNGIPVNEHRLMPPSYIQVPDGGMDIDYMADVEIVEGHYR